MTLHEYEEDTGAVTGHVRYSAAVGNAQGNAFTKNDVTYDPMYASAAC
jgi:hypothetical protein